MSQPTAGAALPTAPGPKRRSVVLMIVLTLLTLGLYPSIWFLRSRGGLNSLKTDTKISLPPILMFSLLQLITLFVDLEGLNSRPAASIVSLANLVFWLVLSFRIKRLLEEHLASSLSEEGGLGGIARASAEISGVLTFFFTIYYLQHVINTRVLTRTSVDG